MRNPTEVTIFYKLPSKTEIRSASVPQRKQTPTPGSLYRRCKKKKLLQHIYIQHCGTDLQNVVNIFLIRSEKCRRYTKIFSAIKNNEKQNLKA